MEGKERKYNSQLEISDLIDGAVKNAMTRRNEVLDSEETLLSMSDEEAKSVTGGISLNPTIVWKPFTPVVTAGIIIRQDPCCAGGVGIVIS
ncbi:hypothetical protein LC605_21875 [Nostoc sp. CHAB 5836]|uniref:hypothetical protein n=1 Tax=Nostoc sp. CHAB 5836 TaxID=2780404 RepID=UPI001E52F602|nr:hypothetical protein [Nostoc sp. CHAB 5836]MCC5617689.1 hypothetical protein [Nostoc sp. CHAB 5836]